MTSAALAVGLIVLVAAVVADLLFSPGYMRRVRAAVAAGDPSARLRMYRLTLVVDWIAAAVALGILLAGGLSLAEIGFRAPDLGNSTFTGLYVGMAAGLVVGAVVIVRQGRRDVAAPTVGDVDVLIPRTASERRWFAAVAITAGFTEEIFYRAFALTLLMAVLPGGEWLAVAVAAVLFGAAHLYQGRAGVLVTGLLAVLFGALYLISGSLWPSIVVHALMDLRVLLVRVPAPAEQTAGG